MDALYSEDRIDVLEEFIEDCSGIEEQDYVLPAARIMQKNEEIIEFIERCV